MSGIVAPITGTPGVRAIKTASHRIVFKGGVYPDFLPQGKLINGTKSRDVGNTGNIDVLRAGLLMGKISSTGLYANAIIGPTTAVNAAGDTTVTVSAAVATEIVRRIGTSGTFTLIGPPAASGVVAVQTVTFSAVNTTTGAITVTALGAASISGSLIGDTDGSQTPITLIPDGYGIKVTDVDGTTNVTAEWATVPVYAELITANIVNYPSDSSLKAWIKASMNGLDGGQFIFDDRY